MKLPIKNIYHFYSRSPESSDFD